jgi:hypothetical protein
MGCSGHWETVVLCRGEDRKRLLFSEEKRSKKDFIYLGGGTM